jgi:hypothetical protein
MPLSKSDKLKLIIAKTNEFMPHQYPEEWSIIRHFAKTIKNPFVLWHYYKKILLALGVPIIEEPIEKEIYIGDILKNDKLNEYEKEEDIEFRKEYHKEVTIWFHRSKFGESTGISDHSLRKIEDNAYPLKDFGYDDMDELKSPEVKQIKVVKEVHNLQDSSKMIKLDCKYLEKAPYKRLEPVGSITQNQPGQIYLPHTDIKKILRIQGRNSDVCHLLGDLLEAIVRYQSCAISMALEVRSENKIDSLSQMLSDIREDTREIKSDMKDLSKKLTHKKEAVMNTQSKGVLILRVRTAKVNNLFPKGVEKKKDEYIYYIHGGLDYRWEEYTEDKENYVVIRTFPNISDYDKFLREVKDELDLNKKVIKPKRNFLILNNSALDRVIGCYSIRDSKCDIE